MKSRNKQGDVERKTRVLNCNGTVAMVTINRLMQVFFVPGNSWFLAPTLDGYTVYV